MYMSQSLILTQFIITVTSCKQATYLHISVIWRQKSQNHCHLIQQPHYHYEDLKVCFCKTKEVKLQSS